MIQPSSESGPVVWYPHDATVHGLVQAQARRTPDATAVICRDESWTFGRLDGEANRLARSMVSLGVCPGDLVGLAVGRSCRTVALQLAVLKAGAAYVPLDPAYPAERTRFMAADAGLRFVLADATSRAAWRGATSRVVDAEDLSRRASELPDDDPGIVVDAQALCWVLYTSGSTGKPKGVMIRHRNVVGFLGAMDRHIPFDDRSAWLAVTSISFDISVLEIFWPLSRGVRVVLWEGAETPNDAAADAKPPVGFSLFFFANAGSEDADPYRVLLDGARFADTHGFEAVWTPERHFHDFGGIYPNPSLAAAAIATITSRVGIRAGSCVVPLHHPIRVAEEWAFVDRISGGRVGLAAAAGWNPNDFVLRPEAYAHRKERLFTEIDKIRALWRGDEVPFENASGDSVGIRTLPRPIQSELPVWITVAGNPETFRAAGERGHFVLTHLLGQTVDEIAERIAEYRRAWRRAGHPGQPKVTLMVHAFVGEDDQAVRELVREPMIRYLRGSFDLVKRAAWAFPTFRQGPGATGPSIAELLDRQALSDDEVEQLLEFSFERYFETAGLFGTLETCMKLVEKLDAAGADELACLIDFGVDPDRVVAQLPHLDRLRQMAAGRPRAGRASIPELARRHGITHFQCTPTMARMLQMEPGGNEALSGLDVLMVGGEALPPATAASLRAVTPRAMLNLYGPTETTIWSMVYPIDRAGQDVLIGRPIANTVVHLLDDALRPVAAGKVGEVFIGGDGVSAGYLNRPELTAERFVDGPKDAAAPTRLYRTGDLARMRVDGQFEFLGRVDQQVKVRGFRVELGEIEAVLSRHPDVADAVAVGREGSLGETELVAFVVPAGGVAPDPGALRAEVARSLPDFMVPARIEIIDAMPTTPNGKTDRAALSAARLPRAEAAPAAPQTRPDRPEVAATTGVPEPLVPLVPPVPPVPLAASEAVPTPDRMRELTAIWAELLRRDDVGPRDNFFEIGGNSLIAARMMSMIRERFGKRLPLTTLLRAPTLEKLIERLDA